MILTVKYTNITILNIGEVIYKEWTMFYYLSVLLYSKGLPGFLIQSSKTLCIKYVYLSNMPVWT